MGAQMCATVAVVLAGIVGAKVALWFFPEHLAPITRHGFCALQRRRASEASVLFRWLEPILQLIAHHVRRLAIPPWRAWISSQLVQAGSPLGLDVDEFLAGTVLTATLAAAVALFAVSQLGFAVVVLLCLLGAYYPHLWLAEAARTRLGAINKGLPYVNDLLVVGMRSGLDFVGALGQYTQRLPNPDSPLGQEFTRLLGELELGATRQEALKSLAIRVPTEPVRSFVNTVIQAEQRGAPLAEALAVQAATLRTQRSLWVEKLASRASVVILLPLLLLFSATVLTLFGGVIVRVVRGEML